MTDEVLPVGDAVLCDCPRTLVTAETYEHIQRRPDGRIYFPPAAPHVGLLVWHREGCRAGLPALKAAS
jgi:hypothetical protein